MLNEKRILFKKNAKEIVLMAQFVSELVRQGVTFYTVSDDIEFAVILTGGY